MGNASDVRGDGWILTFRPWANVALSESALSEIDGGDGGTVAITCALSGDVGTLVSDRVEIALGKPDFTHIVALLTIANPRVVLTYEAHGDAVFGPVFARARSPDLTVTVTRAIRRYKES